MDAAIGDGSREAKEPLALKPSEATRAKESRVERLLAEYLRAWGLRDPSTIAQLCRIWVDRACAQSSADSGANTPLATLYRAAMNEAINDFDNWTEHLVRVVAGGTTPDAGAAGLLALELSTLVDKYPQSLFDYDVLPAEMLDQLGRGRRPIAPPVSPTTMHRQLLEHPTAAPRSAWWREILGTSSVETSTPDTSTLDTSTATRPQRTRSEQSQN